MRHSGILGVFGDDNFHINYIIMCKIQFHKYG